MAGLDYTTRDKALWGALLALCLASAAAYVLWALPAMPESSQLSPIVRPSAGIPLKGRMRCPPHKVSLNISVNRNNLFSISVRKNVQNYEIHTERANKKESL